VTGLSNMEAELGGKRLDLLREAIPGLARVAILAANTDPFTAPFVKDLQTGAARLGLQLQAALFLRWRTLPSTNTRRWHGFAGLRRDRVSAASPWSPWNGIRL
jgi:hypothetical protein